MKQSKVVYVANIAGNSQFILDELVEAAEVVVGEELAGEVTDRQAPAALAGGEEVVAGKVVEDGFLGVAAIDQRINQPEGGGALNFATNPLFENFVIDGWIVFADVALQDVGMAAGQVGEVPQGAVGAKADAVGVGMVNQGFFQDGGDDGAEGVVDDPVGVGGGGDQATFGLEDFEGVVGAGAIGLGGEFGLQLDQLCIKVVVEFENVIPKSFTFLGFASGQ